MKNNKREKIEEKNDGLEYLCPEGSLVKPILKDFLAEGKNRWEHFLILTSGDEFHH